jgi:hypothetical protein
LGYAESLLREQLDNDLVSEIKPLESFRHGEYYHVVGDDVIHSDWRIARVYRDLCSKLNVPLSLNKCFNGNSISEFAGFLAIRTRNASSNRTNLFRPYKVPSEKYVTNPIQFLDSLGVAVKRSPRRRSYWNKVFEAYWNTVDRRDIDLSPLVSQREEDWRSAANKASAKDLVALGNALALLQCDVHGRDFASTNYPTCLAPNSHINSKPLIPEQRPWEHYGFDPKTFNPERDDRRKDWSITRHSVAHDPLLRDALTSQCQLKNVGMEESESTIDKSDLTDTPSNPDAKTDESLNRSHRSKHRGRKDVGPDLD